MVVCAVKTCYNLSTMVVGIDLKVRKLCIDCFDTYFRGGKELPVLRTLNPQETLGDDRFDIK